MNNALFRDLKRLTAMVEPAEWMHSDGWRLGYHLMPPIGWLNDPNGLCQFRGEYHVFYQYAPFDPHGGVKFWGHYKSADMIRWTQCPVMLYSDNTWDIHGVYSGSCLVDEDKMYLYYTGNVKHPGDYDYITTGRGHNTALAVSEDGMQPISDQLLMENKDYPAHLTCHVRDPKVWKQDGKYYMVQGARTKEDIGELLVFESEDKVNWNHINTITTPEKFGYMWECPDLYEVDGQWILAFSPQGIERDGMRFQNIYTCGYFPLYGDFRGEYTLGEFVESDFGFDYYAPQSFEDESGRRICIGWMGMPDADYTNPTAEAKLGWQHCLTVPCEVHYQNGVLTMNPVQEIAALRADKCEMQCSGSTAAAVNEMADVLFEPHTQEWEMILHDCLKIRYADGILSMTFLNGGYGRTERVVPVEQLRNLRLLIDRSAVELFANDGAVCMRTRCYPEGSGRELEIHGDGLLTTYRMQSIQIIKEDGK
ncbi:MAG: glycoside hydrolase family 32 protein [Butyricicoccaceae bacterium]